MCFGVKNSPPRKRLTQENKMRCPKQKCLLKVFLDLGPSFFVHTNLQKMNWMTLNTLSIFAMELYFVLSIKVFVDKGAL